MLLYYKADWFGIARCYMPECYEVYVVLRYPSLALWHPIRKYHEYLDILIFFLSRGIFRVKYILNVSYRCYDGDVNVSYIWVLYFTHIKISTKLLNLWSTNHHLLEPCIWVYDLFSPFAFAISFIVSETRSTLRYRSKTFTRPLGFPLT